MCRLGFHNCPTCGEEYKCDQPNSECPILNNYDGPCQKCEYWQEELERDEEAKYERMMWERDQWMQEYYDEKYRKT